jgi:hypothetical protein
MATGVMPLFSPAMSSTGRVLIATAACRVT